MMAWSACTESAGLLAQNALHPYVIYNNRSVMFEVIEGSELEYASQSQRSFYAVDNRFCR